MVLILILGTLGGICVFIWGIQNTLQNLTKYKTEYGSKICIMYSLGGILTAAASLNALMQYYM